jgi:hypothetical protein
VVYRDVKVVGSGGEMFNKEKYEGEVREEDRKCGGSGDKARDEARDEDMPEMIQWKAKV